MKNGRNDIFRPEVDRLALRVSQGSEFEILKGESPEGAILVEFRLKTTIDQANTNSLDCMMSSPGVSESI